MRNSMRTVRRDVDSDGRRSLRVYASDCACDAARLCKYAATAAAAKKDRARVLTIGAMRTSARVWG